MEYPGSKITKPVRRAILLAFLAAFFIIAPIIILYTEGYRYDWQNWQRGIFKETGAISIDIAPKNATVYLNDTKLNSKIPIRLKNVAPQKYYVKITSPGYYDWSREIEVKSKQTIYIKDISMIKKTEPALAVEGDIFQLFISPNETYLIYTVNKEQVVEIRIKNLREGEDIKFMDWQKEEKIKVEWAVNNNYFAISAENPPYNKVIATDAGNPEKQTDLVERNGQPITKYSWKETSEPEIFFSTASAIMSYLPQTNRVQTLSKNIFLDWVMENGQLWTLQEDADKQQFITRDTLGFSSVFKMLSEDSGTNRNLVFLAAKNNVALLKKSDASEMILIAGDKTYDIAGEQFFISKYNNWWLIWTPWELWSYNQGEEPMLLNRSGEQLQDVIALDRYNTLALRWAEKTTILFPYYYVSHNLLNSPVNDVVADSVGRVLYFVGELNGQQGLWKMDY